VQNVKSLHFKKVIKKITMSYYSPRHGGSSSPKSDSSQPDFENNLAEFESAFQKFVAETDPGFDLGLLHFNFNPFVSENIQAQIAKVWYPTSKQELEKTITLEGPAQINAPVLGEHVRLTGDIRIKGNVIGIKSVSVGANCVVEGHLISGGSLQIADGCRVEGTVSGEEIVITGLVKVQGPVVCQGDFKLNGTFEAQSLVAVKSISLQGSEKDYLKLDMHSLFVQNGEVDTRIPVKLGHSGRLADLSSQLFYLSHASDGTFRLARAPSSYQDGMRPAQGTILTILSDVELEKMLAELATLER